MYKLIIRSNFFLSVGSFIGLAIAIPNDYGRLESSEDDARGMSGNAYMEGEGP